MHSKKLLIICGSIVAIFAMSTIGYVSIKRYEKASEINLQTNVEKIKVEKETELEKKKIEEETKLQRTKERMSWNPWYKQDGN